MPSASGCRKWLGPEGVHYIREQMLSQYILKSMGAAGSDIDRFEGTGALNFLALHSRCVGQEGHLVDPLSILSVSFVDGHPRFPALASPDWDGFRQRVQASGKKWIILTDTDGTPQLVMNSNHFLRVLLSMTEQGTNPQDYCSKPVITTNPQDTIEHTLHNAISSETTPDTAVILVWSSEKRIISHTDLLQRLFEGVFPSAPAVPHAR